MSDEAREAVGDYQFGFHDPENATIRFDKGLSEQVVRDISALKDEPQWMTDMRVKAYHHFMDREMPDWGNCGELNNIDFDNVTYFLRSSDATEKNWDDVPDDIKNTFDRLGIPEAEQKWLGGVTAQYESEAVYHSIREDLEAQGVLFLDMDSGLKEHPEIVKQYFGTVIPYSDNKFSALNTAVWSGGSFIYVPKGVHVEMPVQAYFRINAQNMGQFERTLIIADEGSSIHYVEGCTAPTYSTDSLHSAVVELIAMKGAKIRYSTIQNWSANVYNLVTKRGVAHENATVEWVDGNIGSKLTMKYPAVLLKGEGAHAEVISVAYAGAGQHQDAGAKVHHLAPNTTSSILSKSISKNGGRSSYRGMLQVTPKSHGCRSKIVCDALMLDNDSRSDTYPTMEIGNSTADLEHEASVSKVSSDQLFYLMSRGFSEEEAMGLIVNGFFEPFTRELPMEYAVELNKLLELEMEGFHRMKYADMAVPSRALHLWRYTPWARIHPSKVDEVPEANGVRFSVVEGGELVDGAPRIVNAQDIGRVFLSELGGSATTFESDGTSEVVHLQAVASGHVAVGHLHLSLKHDVAVMLHLSGEADWTGLHITGTIAPNVRAGFGLVNELDANGRFLHCEDWTIPRDASLELAGLSIGGFRCKSDIRSRLTGSGAALTQAISVHGVDQRHVDHHIEIHHDVPHTDSSLNIHAAEDNQSHAIATGLLTIARNANHCDAGQVFKNLLLSERARAESIPELEVLADEVSAAHGAASAPVDQNQLHYLMSRGLDHDTAVALLIEGFMQDGFSTLQQQKLVDEMRTRLTVHLECELKR